METVTINSWLEKFNSFPMDDKEYAIDLIRRTFTEERRNEIAENAKKANEDLLAGNCKTGNLQKLLTDLEND